MLCGRDSRLQCDPVHNLPVNLSKLSGSVSKNTFVLVNNDVNSTSSKNKTAKELNVPIMSEEEFVNLYLK